MFVFLLAPYCRELHILLFLKYNFKKFFVCLFFGYATCGILVPQPGIESVAPAVEGQEAWSPDHRTTRELPPFLFYEVRVCGGGCRGGGDGGCEDRNTAFLWSGSPTGCDLTPMVPPQSLLWWGRGCPVAESPLSQQGVHLWVNSPADHVGAYFWKWASWVSDSHVQEEVKK